MKPISIINKLNENELIVKTCPMCGSTFTINLTDDLVKKYNSYKYSNELIQDVLPELNPMEREFLMTGMCPNCQKDYFDVKYTSDKFKPYRGD